MECRVCGETNPAHARFCLGCASAFGGSAPVVAAGERRRISVLFADIAGSTALISGTEPEEALQLLEGVLRRMAAAVHRFGGVVNRIAGDGIMALFGAPLPHEDHARRACMAALSMQAEITLASTRNLFGRPIRIRVGLNSGEALVRSVANDMHSEYAAEGEMVHLAAKAEQAAEPGAILVLGEVAQRTEGFFDFRPRPPLPVGGRSEPVFELLRATEAASRFQVSAGRGLSPLVGRDAELRRLKSAAAEVRGGAARIVGVTGEGGAGKTRLLWELRQQLRAEGFRTLAAHATARGARSAFHPVLAVLKGLFGLADSDGAAEIEQALAQHPLDRAALSALLERPVADRAWETLDSGQRAERIQRALLAAWLAGIGSAPTAIFIEDVHEADTESLAFLNLLARRLRDEPLLLLLEYRAAGAALFPPGPNAQELELAALPAAASAVLFRHLARAAPAFEPLAAELVARAQGNPFFIEECVRMLDGLGLFGALPGLPQPAAPAHAMPLPMTVREMLETRIARLPRWEREVIQAAAVLGRDIAPAMLAAMLDQGALDLQAALTYLVEAELLSALPQATVYQFAFRHAFVLQTVYDSLPRSQRQALHARALRIIDSPGAVPLAAREEQLAHHAVNAGDCVRALACLQDLARRAVLRSALREAVDSLDRALALLPQLGDAERALEIEIDIRLGLRGPLVALGRVARIAGEVERLEAIAPACADPVRRARVAAQACGHHWFTGAPLKAVDAGLRAIGLATQVAEPRVLVPARQYVGGALHALGDLEGAVRLLGENVEQVPELEPGHGYGMAGLPAVFCRATRGWVHQHAGRYALAIRDAEDALRIGRASGHGFSLLSAMFTGASVQLSLGDDVAAGRVLQEAVALCRAERQHMWRPLHGAMLALAWVRRGDPAAARMALEDAVPDRRSPVLTTFTLLTVGEVLAALGETDEARRLALAMLARARRHRERLWEAESLYLLGQLELSDPRQPADAAAASLRAALSLSESLGLLPLGARCRQALAQVYARCGWPEASRLRAAEATAAYHALGVPAPLPADSA